VPQRLDTINSRTDIEKLAMDFSPLHDASFWLLQTTTAAAIGAGVTLLTEHFKKKSFE